MYLKDNKTGKKVKISNLNLFEIQITPVISLVLYGLIVSFILTIAGFSVNIVNICLLIAYILDLALWFTKLPTPTKILMALIIMVLWYPVFSLLIKEECANKHTTEKIETIISFYNVVGKRESLFAV